MQSRLFATVVAAAIATAPIHVVYAAPTVEELYTQGQEKFDAGEYGDAGDLWGQAVRLLPEDKNNSATRQTIMNLALDAYLRAYRGTDDRSHIDDAKALLDEYEASLGGAALGDEIASEKGKIDDILAELKKKEEDAAAAAATNDNKDPEPEVTPPPDDEIVGTNRPGRGLVIGGAVLLGVGAAGLGLMVGGIVGSSKAQTTYDNATTQSEADSAQKKGNTMNALGYTGGALAAVGVGAGVALLIIGIRRNNDARNAMVVPAMGPSYVGLGVTGRF